MKKNIKYILVMFTLLLVMSSCVTKPYKTPKNITNQSIYRNNGGDTTSSIASMSWKEYYTDKYLQNHITQAIENNFDIKLAINNIKIANAYYRQNRSALFPSVSAGAQFTAGKTSDVGTSPLPSGVKAPVLDYQFSLSASWEIDIWGKLSSARRASYATMLAQDATKDAVMSQIVSELASAYYQLLSLDCKLKVTEETIKNYGEYLNTVKDMKESAVVNKVAVYQAEAQLFGALAYLPEVKAAIVVTENYFSILLGRPAGKVDRTDSFDIDAITFFDKTGVPAQLLQYRPDVRAAEFALRSSHEMFNVSKAAMYPALRLSGSVGSESMEISDWFKMPTSLFWNAVAGLTQPIFNNRALKTQKIVAGLQNDNALISFEYKIISAGVEVSNAILKTRSLTEKAKFQKQQHTSLWEAYSASQLLLVNGYATYLDVLAAQSGVFSTELSLYDTYYSVMQQKIELFRALGGGGSR